MWGTYDAWWWNHPPMYQEKGLFRVYCKMVKEVVDVPVLCAGRMDDPDMALKSLEDGDCDIINLGRPLLADPDYVEQTPVRTYRWRFVHAFHVRKAVWAVFRNIP